MQRNFIKQLLIENTEPEGTAGSGPYLIIYKKNDFIKYKILFDDDSGTWQWNLMEDTTSTNKFEDVYGNSREVVYGQHYILYDMPDFYSIPTYDNDNNVTGNSIYKLRNFQPNNATLQDELNEMKSKTYFNKLDDDFDFHINLSELQKNYLKQLLIENTDADYNNATTGLGKTLIIYKKNTFILCRLDNNNWNTYNINNTFESWVTYDKTEESHGQYYVLYKTPDIFVISNYDDSGNITENSKYRLRNFQASDATLGDEINEMKSNIHFKELNGDFDFNTSLTDAQKNYLKQILIENPEPNISASWLIIYMKNKYAPYKIDEDGSWTTTGIRPYSFSPLPDSTEIDFGQHYVLYEIPDIYNVPNYDNSGNITGNSRYKIRNFQPSDATLQDELTEMKSLHHFKALDETFDLGTSLSSPQIDYLKQILMENTDVAANASSGAQTIWLIIYMKNKYAPYKIGEDGSWTTTGIRPYSFSPLPDSTEIDFGQYYALYDTPDTFVIPNYDSGGNIVANSEYRLRNFQPSNAILLDELNEIKNDINFKALDDSFNFDTSLTDAQKNYLKQILMENTEPNASASWVGPYIINYKQNSYSSKAIGSDGNFFSTSGHQNYPIDGIENIYIRSMTEINSAQHYLLYKIPDIYTIYEYDGDGNVNGNTLYRLRNFQPSNATLQAEVNEMKNSIYFKELDDDFNFDTTLSISQRNYIKQILSENMEPSGTEGTGGPFLIIYKNDTHKLIQFRDDGGWDWFSHSNSFDDWSVVAGNVDTEIEQGSILYIIRNKHFRIIRNI